MYYIYIYVFKFHIVPFKNYFETALKNYIKNGITVIW